MPTRKIQLLLIIVWILSFLCTGCSIYVDNINTITESENATNSNSTDATEAAQMINPPTIMETPSLGANDDISTSTRTATPSVQVTRFASQTPLPLPPSPTPTNIAVLQVPSPTPDFRPTTELTIQCPASEPLQVEETSLAQGIALVRNENEPQAFTSHLLGQRSFYDLHQLQTYPYTQFTEVTISPNNEWLAYTKYNTIGNEVELDMLVTNSENEHVYETRINSNDSVQFDIVRWLSSDSLIEPVTEDPDLLEWVVWFPQLNEKKKVSLSVVGIKEAVRKYRTIPEIDPLGELIIYPCDFCDETEFIVADLVTGETKWEVDIGPHSPTHVRGQPIWSPNGEYVALTGVRDWSLSSGILIFRRDGSLLHEIVLPANDGVHPGVLTWSPDSSLLAFRRSGEEQFNYTLAYVSINNGAVVDTCVDFPDGFPYWSPDSSMIAFPYQTEASEGEAFIVIVPLATGEVIQLLNPESQRLVGWLSWQ